MEKVGVSSDKYAHIVAWMPHTGTYLPHVPNVPEFERLRQDAQLLADWKVDELYAFLPNKITSVYSRFAVDLERYADDDKEPMSRKGIGMLYTRLTDGTPFDRSVFGADAFFARYYHQQHTLLKTKLEEAGNGSLLLDLHSFNPYPLPCDEDQSVPRPDICLGFNQDKTRPADAVIEAIRSFLEAQGLNVKLNSPFSGAMTANTSVRYTALMIEINKSFYLTDGKLCGDLAQKIRFLRTMVDFLCEQEHKNSRLSAGN